MTALPVSGSIADRPLPQILIELYRTRFTGALELSRAKTLKTFLFQNGAPVGSESNIASEGLAAVLEDAGTLVRKQREAVDAYVQKHGGKEAVALLTLGFVEAKELFAGLREQVRRRMIECFSWPQGEYGLTPTEQRTDDIQPLRVDPYALVQGGLAAHWPIDRMLEPLQASMNRYATPTPQLGAIARRLDIDATVQRMIASLNGTQTLGVSVGAALSSPAALAAFWVVDAAGGLAYSDTPESTNGEDPTEIEIQITGETAPTAGPAATAVATSGTAAAADEAPRAENPAAEKMRAEVLDRLERLDSLDFYELLEIARDADHGAIRKAYFVAAKRYHPDAIARLDLTDIRGQAGEVFSKIAEANDVLSDATRRAAYDRSLDGGAQEIDVGVIAQAETFYRKGEILIKMGDFKGALEYLQNAVTLYPDEAVYQSDLAWAYYKKSPPEPKPALEHIRKALELDPSDAVALFRLGVLERTHSE